jgi:3-hydroxybutyryl-CoA dehydrogenase
MQYNLPLLYMHTTINTIAVCGAGTMGAGIAQCAAQNGFYTLLFDVNETTLAKAKNNIEKSLSILVTKEKITIAQEKSILQNIKYVSDVQECMADVIIEAIVEKLEIKIALFNQLAEINHGETIFATNTSSLSVTQIANGVLHPHRVIGMHFFNPATIMKLVEVVATDFANTTMVETIMQLAKDLQKTPVFCKDAPGFIVNRVARHFYLEPLRLAEQHFSTYENMDALLENAGFKMGPFKLMDLIGNDINYAVTESLYKACNEAIRFKPSYIQKEKVDTGKLGKKTGEGYFVYN